MDPIDRRIASRLQFHEALRVAFANIASSGCREVYLCDDDFADWPLGEPAVVASLTEAARSRRSFCWLARHFDEPPRRHPRWVAWRREWSHAVQCRTVDAVLPALLIAPGLLTLRLFDRVHVRGVLSTVAAEADVAKQQFDAFLQQSVDGFPATTLGL